MDAEAEGEQGGGVGGGSPHRAAQGHSADTRDCDGQPRQFSASAHIPALKWTRQGAGCAKRNTLNTHLHAVLGGHVLTH